MSDIIRLLPESVANQIAAGEIVPEPSYIVKELLENAIDAGATKIQVRVVEGGRNLIQITDNGKGMSPTDARMAFERHATSKIRAVEDLDCLHTMGFRGEALNAISSIASVEMRTCPKGSKLGTKVCIEGGNIKSVESCVCPEGTTFVIMDIFFNYPVRRRELTKMSIDRVYSHVKREFNRVALVNPQIAISLHHAQNLYKDLPISTLKERILAISSKRTRNDLLPIHSENPKVKINGFIGKPDSARKQGANQFFFVNNRYMEHAFFKNAIVQTFKPYFISEDGDKKEPNYFIYFEVAPESIDVNISPMKTDVRFLDEELIEIFLRTLIRSVLSANAVLPTIDFTNEQTVNIPPSVDGYKTEEEEEEEDSEQEVVLRRHVFLGNTMNKGAISIGFNDSNSSSTHSSAKETSNRTLHRFQPKTTSSKSIDWLNISQKQVEKEEPKEDLFGDTLRQEKNLLKPISIEDIPLNTKGELAAQSYCFFQGRYLLLTTKEQILVIDIEFAYERVLYERYKKEIASAKIEISSLLFPEELKLTDTEVELLHKLRGQLKSFGFSFNSEKTSLSLVEAPTMLHGQELSILQRILHEAQNRDASLEDLFLAELLSKQIAILNRSTYPTTDKGLVSLLTELFACEEKAISPSGQGILKILSSDFISKLF